MKKRKEKLECKKSPTGKHKWEETKEIHDGRRNDWGCIPGEYCVHCGERKKENKKKA